MRLTTNFTLEEMIFSQTASRYGLSNSPSQQVIGNLQRLCENVLQPLRNAFGPVVVSSGYRSSLVNSRVGGAANSDHLYGCAADITIPGIANINIAEYIKNKMDFKQVILEFPVRGLPYAGWVHVSYEAGKNTKECLTAVKSDGKTVYLKGLIQP
mgnify:CR=1 FL=1